MDESETMKWRRIREKVLVYATFLPGSSRILTCILFTANTFYLERHKIELKVANDFEDFVGSKFRENTTYKIRIFIPSYSLFMEMKLDYEIEMYFACLSIVQCYLLINMLLTYLFQILILNTNPYID